MCEVTAMAAPAQPLTAAPPNTIRKAASSQVEGAFYSENYRPYLRKLQFIRAGNRT